MTGTGSPFGGTSTKCVVSPGPLAYEEAFKILNKFRHPELTAARSNSYKIHVGYQEEGLEGEERKSRMRGATVWTL